MAAGFGSRFGSLKQLHAVHINGYAIIDYSVYDAISAGFNIIIFIVRKEILNTFQAKYSSINSDKVSIHFVVQETNNIPKKYATTRVKPWGTGHALLTLKNIVKTPFALINADDLYGKEAFKLIHDALFHSDYNTNYFIGYKLENTLSKSGSVSRGECYLNEDKFLKQVEERTQIRRYGNKIVAHIDTAETNEIEISPNTIVSMNFWGLTPDIFSISEKLFTSFLVKNSADNEAEFYLPSIIDYTIQKTNKRYKMLFTKAQWFGITYPKDQDLVTKQINEYIEQKIYPDKLW